MTKRKERVPTALFSSRKTRSATARMAKEATHQAPVSCPPLLAEKETVVDFVKTSEEVKQQQTPKKTKIKANKKKIKKTETEMKTETETVADVTAKTFVSGKVNSIIIEACKQCQSFNRTALKVKDGLQKNKPEVEVTINPEKPRRGCFEVRDVNGEIFISLLVSKVDRI